MSACRLGKFGARSLLYKPYWGLTFTAEQAGVVINMVKVGSPSNVVTLETSFDGATWTSFDADNQTTPITLANVGDKVYFRSGTGGNETIGDTISNYRRFTSTGLFSASGNIMSIIDGTDPSLTEVAGLAFLRLFAGSPITSAPDLPALTLGGRSYAYMFYNCTHLIKAPFLPSTTVETNEYDRMFSGCSSLTEISVSFASWPTTSVNWVSGVSATGTFKCPAALGTNETITRGVNSCPEGWTVVNI